VELTPVRTPGFGEAKDVPAIARVVSVNIGQPQPRHRLLGDGTTSQHYLTAIVKQPVHGPVSVQPLGLEGDAHGDTVGHGGADKAVHFQFRQHLDWLGDLAGRPVLPGEIGENLTLAAIAAGDPEPAEADFCVGDVLVIGSATLQVTQPRIPCYKQAEQTGVADVVARIVASGRTGLHLRVLTEGVVRAGDLVYRSERPQPDWTIRRVHQAVHTRGTPEERAALAALPELSAELKRRFAASR
jgi:MOSC domain-containing protein YiiM